MVHLKLFRTIVIRENAEHDVYVKCLSWWIVLHSGSVFLQMMEHFRVTSHVEVRQGLLQENAIIGT